MLCPFLELSWIACICSQQSPWIGITYVFTHCTPNTVAWQGLYTSITLILNSNRVPRTELTGNFTQLLSQNTILVWFGFLFNQNKHFHDVEGKRKSVSWDMSCVILCFPWAYWYNWKEKLTVNKPAWVNENWSKLAKETWNKQELISSGI